MYSGNVDEMKRFEGQHVPKSRDIIKRVAFILELFDQWRLKISR